MTTEPSGSTNPRTDHVSAVRVFAWGVGILVAGVAVLIAMPALQAFFMMLSAP